MADGKSSVKVVIRDLDEYQEDPGNANKGTPRGQQMLVDSLQENGPGRSVLAGGDDILIAGSHALRAAKAAGIKRAIEVEVPPDAMLVAKRSDLIHGTDEATRMALADNRTNQVNLDFNPAVLLAKKAALLDKLWRQDEIDELSDTEKIASMVNDAVEHETTPDRKLGKSTRQIKPVLYVDEVALFERALAATGLRNRGQAVLEVCRFFLEHHGGVDDDTLPKA